MFNSETAIELIRIAGLPDGYKNEALGLLAETDSRYLRDLKMNLKSVLETDYITAKEGALIALSVATNANNDALISYFNRLALENGASQEEASEMVACASLLSSNNVFYRFRHFTGKDKYQQLPARLRMNIMMNPATGKEFFELASLVVSAVNGCQACVNAHEASLIEMGSKEERIFDAVRIGAVLTSLSKLIR